jgi:hypothetical protein
MWRFFVGTAFVAFSFPVAQTVALSVYTKVLGTEAQGTMIGILNAVGSSARLLGKAGMSSRW